MGSKNGLAYEVRGVDINTNGKWDEAHLKIKEECEYMNGFGWTLCSMTWPQLEHAVLVFTRPAKAE